MICRPFSWGSEQICQVGSFGDPIPISLGLSAVQSGRQGTWKTIKSDPGECASQPRPFFKWMFIRFYLSDLNLTLNEYTYLQCYKYDNDFHFITKTNNGTSNLFWNRTLKFSPFPVTSQNKTFHNFLFEINEVRDEFKFR